MRRFLLQMMSKSLVIIAMISLSFIAAKAQNNVGIGTNTPRSSAQLEVRSNNQGILIPRVDTTQMTGLIPADNGLIVYDTIVGDMFVWTGSQFLSLTQGGDAGGEPVGTIMAFAGGAVPAGYLLADGTAVSRTTYADLFAAIGTTWGSGDGSTTFNLPDLRGRFLRGVDFGAGNDPDAAARSNIIGGGNTGDNVGSYQNDATARPNTNFTTNTTGDHNHSFGGFTNINSGSTSYFFQENGNQTVNLSTGNAGNHSHSITGGGDNETRPINAYVQYIIKHEPGGSGGGGGGGGGTVTSVTAGIGLTGGTITTSGTINLDVSGVTPGSYGSATEIAVLNIDQYGRVTGASTVALPGSTVSLDSLTDVSLTGVTVNDFLRYDGANWVNNSSIFPVNETVTTAGTPFTLNHTGLGVTMSLSNTSPFANDYVLSAEALGDAIAGYFVNNQATATNQALYAHTLGSGPALVGLGLSNNASAARFANTTAGNALPTLILENAGTGLGLNVVSGGVQIDELGGGGQKMLVVDNNGLIDTLAIPGGANDTIPANVFSARIDGAAGTPDANRVLSENFEFIQTVTRTGIGSYTITFVPGFFTETPAISAVVNDPTFGPLDASVVVPSSNSCIVRTGVSGAALGDHGFQITAVRQGADYQNTLTAPPNVIGQWDVNGADLSYTSGNVGIGIATPSAALSIQTVAGIEIDFPPSANNVDISASNQMNIQTTNALLLSGSDASLTGGTNDFRINSNGAALGGFNPTPNPHADLTLTSSDKGFQLNRVDTNFLSLIASDRGMIVYDTVENQLFIWNGTNFEAAGSGTGAIDTIPANVFSGKIDAAGVLLSQSHNFISNVTRLSAGIYDVTFEPGYFTETPSIIAESHRNDGNSSQIVIVSASSSGFVLRSNGTGGSIAFDSPIDFIVQRQGADYQNTLTAPPNVVGYWQANGSDIYVDTVTGVGIGTNTPGVTLDVQSSGIVAFRTLSGGTATSIAVGRTVEEMQIGVAAGSNQFSTDAQGGDAILRNTSGGNLLIQTGIGASAITVSGANDVGIKTTNPSTNADLTLGSTNKGLQLNKVDTSALAGLGSSDAGLMVYDTTDSQLYIWNGTNFEAAGSGGGAIDTIPANVFSAFINGSAGAGVSVVSSSNNFIQSVSRISQGRFQIDFVPGYFTEAPSAQISLIATDGPNSSITSITSSQIIVRLELNNVFFDADFYLTLQRQGADYQNTLTAPPNVIGQWDLNTLDLSYSAGNVGIGETTPNVSPNPFAPAGSKFVHLKSTGTPFYVIEKTDAATGKWGMTVGGNGEFMIQEIEPGGNNVVAIEKGAIISQLYLQSGGNVGIGLNNPAYRLDVNGDVNIPAGQRYRQGGTHLISLDGTSNVRIGDNSGQAITSGTENITIGRTAGSAIQDGFGNIAIGGEAMRNTVSGIYNIGVGRLAGVSVTSGNSNTAIGGESMHNTTTGSGNTALGTDALYDNITGSNNTAIGNGSDVVSTNLTNATAIGALAQVDASNSLVLGSINGVGGATADVSVGIGTTSPNPNASLDLGHNNRGLQLNRVDTASLVLTAADRGMIVFDSTENQLFMWDGFDWISATAGGADFWSLAGNSGLDGANDFIGTTDTVSLYFRVNNQPSGVIDGVNPFNTSFGYLTGNSTGINNAAFGHAALAVNTADGNAAFGSLSMESNTTGNANTGMGFGTLRFSTTGVQNTAVGNAAMENNDTGNDNVAVGYLALLSNIGANGNTAVGSQALLSSDGEGNTAIGYNALATNVTGTFNTGLGHFTDVGFSDLTNATAIGFSARVDSSNSIVLGGTGANEVNVGIGVPGPLGDLHISSSGINTSIYLTNDALGTTDTDGLLFGETNGGDAIILNYENNRMFIGTNATLNQLVLDATGNVGIGDSNPANRLSLTGGNGLGIVPATGGFNFISFYNSNDGNVAWGINDGWTVNRDFRIYMYDGAGAFIGQPFTIQDTTGFIGIGNGNINPAVELDLTGTLRLTEEVQRDETGDANLVPIALGSINFDGSIIAGTGNYNVAQIGSGTYRIDFPARTLTQEVIVSAIAYQPGGGAKAIVDYEISGGDLIIYTHDGGGGGTNLTDYAFSFTLFIL